MNAQERFDNLPNQFQPLSTEAVVRYWLKGQLVSANHPITEMNPTEFFVVHEVKFESGRTYVRGENTMWFSEEMIKVDVVGM